MKAVRWIIGALLWLLAGLFYLVAVGFEYLGDGVLAVAFWVRER